MLNVVFEVNFNSVISTIKWIFDFINVGLNFFFVAVIQSLEFLNRGYRDQLNVQKSVQNLFAKIVQFACFCYGLSKEL